MSIEMKSAGYIIGELEAKVEDGYLLRGEPKHYPGVTSSLYRSTAKTFPQSLERISDQEDLLAEICLRHCDGDSGISRFRKSSLNLHEHKRLQRRALKKLSEIQHLGGESNLIDFTTSYHCALFFACNKYPQEDGRIILIHPTQIPAIDYLDSPHQSSQLRWNGNRLIPWGEHHYIRRKIGEPPERADAQESVFIHAKSGILNPDLYKNQVINIPREIKPQIIQWLADTGFNHRSMYPETIGFLKNRERLIKANEYEALAEHQLLKTRVYRYVIESCKKSTDENYDSYVYYLWGIAHLLLDEKKEAIDKFNYAIAFDNLTSLPVADQNAMNAVTLTARNIAEQSAGKYPTPDAIFSLNHSMGKGYPRPRDINGMPVTYSHFAMFSDSHNYFKRWWVLNVFYDYEKLWDALPQLSPGERQVTQKWMQEHEAATEGMRSDEDRNRECYLNPGCPDFYDWEFYRPFLPDEIENPLAK